MTIKSQRHRTLHHPYQQSDFIPVKQLRSELVLSDACESGVQSVQ